MPITAGQKFYDEPVFVNPKKPPVLQASVERALYGDATRVPSILVRHERVELRWMKPGPDGKLVPK